MVKFLEKSMHWNFVDFTILHRANMKKNSKKAMAIVRLFVFNVQKSVLSLGVFYQDTEVGMFSKRR